MRVLICGGGVIGACLAAFLTRRGAEVVLVDRIGVACAASGKSGGFLARDWCDGGPLQQMARRSFALHEQLAREATVDWGYRRTTASAGFGDGRLRRIANTGTAAQIDPAAFTKAMAAEAEAAGAQIRIGVVEGLTPRDARTRLAGAIIDGVRVEADAVVLAMGPWTVLACQWASLPAIYGLKGHSLLLRPRRQTSPEAMFLETRDSLGPLSPEVFPRANGDIYLCGVSSDASLPVDPARVAPDDGAIERLHALRATISPELAEAEVLVEQACHRPLTADGLPIIGAIPGFEGGYVATGHNVWGMLNAPATGQALAELILDGATMTIDLAAFDPARLPVFRPA